MALTTSAGQDRDCCSCTAASRRGGSGAASFRCSPTSARCFAPTLAGSLGGAPLPGRGRSLLEALADDLEDSARLGRLGRTGGDRRELVRRRGRARARGSGAGDRASSRWRHRGSHRSPTRRSGPPSSCRLRRPSGSRSRFTHAWPGGRPPAGSTSTAHAAPRRSIRTTSWRACAPSGASRSCARSATIASAGGGCPIWMRSRCPVTFVQGTRDRAVPMWMHRRWVAAVPSTEIILDGFPHCPHLRDPERVAALILAAE